MKDLLRIKNYCAPTNKRVAKRYGRGNDSPFANCLQRISSALEAVAMCVKGFEKGDVVVKYRSVLFREEKAFLESVSWEEVLEQTPEHTCTPKVEIDC